MARKRRVTGWDSGGVVAKPNQSGFGQQCLNSLSREQGQRRKASRRPDKNAGSVFEQRNALTRLRAHLRDEVRNRAGRACQGWRLLRLSDLTLFPVKARSHSDQVLYLSGRKRYYSAWFSVLMRPRSLSTRNRPLPLLLTSASLSSTVLNSFSSSCCSATYHCRKLKVE